MECFLVRFGGRLLISGSKVRVLDGPPMITGASRTPEAPADWSADLDLVTSKTLAILRGGSKNRGTALPRTCPVASGMVGGISSPVLDAHVLPGWEERHRHYVDGVVGDSWPDGHERAHIHDGCEHHPVDGELLDAME